MRDYNDAVQRVPDLMIARAFGFVPAEFYQAHPAERHAVKAEIGSAR